MINTNTFSITELSEEQYEENKKTAYKMFQNGEKPYISTDISELLSAGYGRLDEYGFFEYPLVFNHEEMYESIDKNGYEKTDFWNYIMPQ